ncbi:MAG: HEAT repeat domain-containing protein, partial [Planctomycetota bacterium]|jgi:HEAT repeat protein
VLTLELLKELLAKGEWWKIEKLLRYAVVEDPVGVQELLIQALGKVRNAPAMVGKLLGFLTDETARKRAVEGLLALTRSSGDVHVLKGALAALGGLGDGETAVAVSGWISALSPDDEKYQEKAATALFALAKIGTPESATELARLLQEQQGTKLQGIVVKAIGEMDVSTPQMVEALRPFLGEEAPPALRQAAVRALGYMGADESVGPLREVFASESASKDLKDEALLALGRVGSGDAVRELIRIMKEDEEYGFAAGMSLRNVESKEAVEPLLEELGKVEDSRVKAGMVTALGNIEDERAAPALRTFLGDSEETSYVRSQSAQSLGKIGDPAAVDAYAGVLGSWKEEDATVVHGVLAGAQYMARRPASSTALVEKVLPAVKEIEANSKPGSRLHQQAVMTRHRLEMLGRGPANTIPVPNEDHEPPKKLPDPPKHRNSTRPK